MVTNKKLELMDFIVLEAIGKNIQTEMMRGKKKNLDALVKKDLDENMTVNS